MPLVSCRVGEGLEAVVRLGEMIGRAGADTVVRGDPGDAPLRVALAFARRPVTPPSDALPRSAYIPEAESPYASAKYPGRAYRVLAAYRWWNAIHYFYPYKHLIGEDWWAVLPRSIRLSMRHATRSSTLRLPPRWSRTFTTRTAASGECRTP